MGRCGPTARAYSRNSTAADRRARLWPADQGEHIVALEIRAQLHMVVCTPVALAIRGRCWPAPVWYKSAPYRSRAVADPRSVLADFGVYAAKDIAIRVWVRPPRSAISSSRCARTGTGGWSEDKLAIW